MARLSRFLKQQMLTVNIAYLRKWLVAGCLVGIAAGLGCVALSMALTWATRLFLGQGAGFLPPAPLGEAEGAQTVVTAIARRWMIPVITAIGGLLAGLIVYKLAPEAEGHGTDSAIEAFHQKEGLIRARVPLVKLLASAITIGSGGSAGPEGPAAQIGAGFASVVGRVLKLTASERRIAVAAGIGAGIACIFRAPLGGAMLGAEILYFEGLEVSALVPSFIASIVGYVIFSSWAGYTPIFGEHLNVTFDDPRSLILYVTLGLICGLVGIGFSRYFYLVRGLFRALRLPNYLKPAVGGLAVGLLGLFLPQVLGVGYGWLQIAMEPQVSLPAGLVIGLAFAKIAATSLTVGSGGSGGTFAPTLFVGGMLGSGLWLVLHNVVSYAPLTPEPFVVVGMVALLGGTARVPLAAMLMVAEMTGSYAMLAPAMIAVSISYVLVGRNTMYESQVESPAMSPAHRYEYLQPLLAQLKVKDAMRTDVVPVRSDDRLEQIEERITSDHITSLPVIDSLSGQLAGIISREDLLRNETRNGLRVGDIMSTNVIATTADESLDTVMQLLSQHDIASLPVLASSGSKSRLVGMVGRRDVMRLYTRAARNLLTRGREEGGLVIRGLAAGRRTGMEPKGPDGQSTTTIAVIEKERATIPPPEKKLQETGLEARTLKVSEVRAGLHEIAEGITARPIYRVSWDKPSPCWPGILSLRLRHEGAGKFVRLSPERVTMPPEASQRLEAARGLGIDEAAVFLDTRLADSHLDLVLAVRRQGQWLELYRWNSSWDGLGISRLDVCSF